MRNLLRPSTKRPLGNHHPNVFLATDQAHEVEVQVRKTSMVANPEPWSSGLDPDKDPDFRPSTRVTAIGDRKLYQVSAFYRYLPFYCLGFRALGIPVVTAFSLVVLLGVNFSWLTAMTNETIRGLIPMYLFGVAVSGPLGLRLLRMPFEIVLRKDSTVGARSWLRTIELRPQDIISIHTGGWSDPRRVQVHVRHKGGKICLFNQFCDFGDFLVRLRSLNPAVKIKGF